MFERFSWFWKIAVCHPLLVSSLILLILGSRISPIVHGDVGGSRWNHIGVWGD